MQAIEMRRFGGPDVLELIEKPTPSPGPGQVLVRVRAVGINLAETLMRENRYAVTPELPAIPGSEIAGTIERMGDGVSGLIANERVAVPLFATGAYLVGLWGPVPAACGPGLRSAGPPPF